MKYLIVLVFAFISLVCGTFQPKYGVVQLSPVLCDDGKTYCSGCQCCPSGILCPNVQPSQCTPNLCPNEVNPPPPPPPNVVCSVCPDQVTACVGCSCCFTTSTLCPSAPASCDLTCNGTVNPPPPPPVVTGQHNIVISNKCAFTIWPASLQNFGLALLNNGGWQQLSGSIVTVVAPKFWAGRFWGRTNCVFNSNGQGTCQTGNCQGLQCNGSGGGAPWPIVAEITFDGSGGNDFYDVSNVDGFNIPMSFYPIASTTAPVSSGNPYWCEAASCLTDINLNCPSVLQVVNGSGVVIECENPCQKYGTSIYCCTGANGTPTTCGPTPLSVPFKTQCPTAYSYPYDDPTSTFQCGGTATTVSSYALDFC